MKKLLVLFICVLLLGCNKKKEPYERGRIKKTYYQKEGNYFGKYKEFYPTGGVKEIHFYENGMKIDSSLYFTERGNIIKKDYHNKNGSFFRKYYSKNETLKKEGCYDSLKRYLGKWKFYEGEILDQIIEYKIIKGKSYLNQLWENDRYGKVDSLKGTYYKLDLVEDTIYLDQPIRAKAIIISDLTKKKYSSVLAVIPKYFTSNFNKDFSNLETIVHDTIYNLNMELEYRKQMGLDEKKNYGSIVTFGRYFEKSGNNNFRGVLVEYYDEKVAPDSLVLREHKYYFDIPVFVKDTLN